MSETQTMLPLEAEPDKLIHCPGCGYGPSGDHDWTVSDQLDLFEVGGADEGCVLCPRCGREFST